MKFKSIRVRLKKELPGITLVTPYLIYFFSFVAFPILYAVYLSFHSGSIISSEYSFVGISNYIEMFKDDLMLKAYKNIVVYSVINIPLVMVGSLFLAIIVNRRIRGIGIFRTIFFLPVAIAPAIVAIIWNWIYSYQDGLLNNIIVSIGMNPKPWLTSVRLSMSSIAFLNVWRNSGYFMVIWLAGLQEIPFSCYESADIDGANNFDKFRYITYPMLLQVRGYIAILLTIMAVRLFTEPYALTQGGPANSTLTPIMYLYFNGFRFFRIGYASAIGVVIVCITFILSQVLRNYFDRKSF